MRSNNVQPPEPGQLVEVRQRRYIVNDVIESGLPPDVLVADAPPPEHLISLTSIEDDALGEELQVIWELEPGVRVLDKAELPAPTGFDPPEKLDAFLHAVRWGAIASADARTLQAPFRSGITIEDYQLDPLVRAVQMPRVNLLVADDVGLGKTIESGLVIQELIVRGRARTVLVVCPAGLQIHWRDQMRNKFGLEFRIVDSARMRGLRRSRGIHVNPWKHFPRLITSIDFIKREHPMRLMREALPAEGEAIYPRRFDILVVDEAHNVAPAGRGKYATDSQRTIAVRTIAPHFEHKLFLSATPHNGYRESFSALLELLDNQRFARGVVPNRQQLEAIMVRRLKSEVEDWAGKARFPKRQLDVIEVTYSEEERQVHRRLKDYSALRLENASSEGQRFASEFVLKLLKKRLFSSPAAFAITLGKHANSVARRATPKRKAPKRPTLGILRRQLSQIEEDYADDDEYEENAAAAVDTASLMQSELTPQERDLLDRMRQWAEHASNRRDSKTEAFIEWLKAIVFTDGEWNDERVIIFTEYRATLNWLQTILAAEDLTSGGRLMTLYGGMDSEQREAIKAAFQANPQQSAVRILLATDAASEGIDLQNYCYRLVHFEIPWNPNRMEQRNGRIDRHGQTKPPQIYHFVGQGYRERLASNTVAPSELEADLEFLMRAAQKVDQIREDLGKVGPVIAEQVEEAMLGKRTRLATEYAEREAGGVRKMLKFERDLRAQVEKHYAQLQETKQTLDLAPENVQAVVETALEIAGQLPLQSVSIDGVEPVFHLPSLTGSWQASTEGLAHPHTGVIRPIVFDHQLAERRDDLVLAHLNHRLVQMALRLLRAQIWSPEGQQQLRRVTARQVPNHALDTPAVCAHARLVVTGGDSHRLHEEVIVTGGVIRKGRFSRLNVGQVNELLAVATDQSVSESMRQQLTAVWPKIQPALLKSLETRMQNRLNGLTNQLAERAQKEKDDIAAILNELAATIVAELDEPEVRQLELFSLDERNQLRRDVEALRRRLEQIPAEIEAEQNVIQARFADPRPRLFPVAVTFLVPERLAN